MAHYTTKQVLLTE